MTNGDVAGAIVVWIVVAIIGAYSAVAWILDKRAGR